MTSRRWQLWLFAEILSYSVIPVVEKLIFRGYNQRRLAGDRGNGPAIIGTACFFTFGHPALPLDRAGVAFARTRSLVPSIITHAIIDVTMTAWWQGRRWLCSESGFFVWPQGCSRPARVRGDEDVGVPWAGGVARRLRD